MPFRWFQKHQKTFMYFVAFFIMPTFLIGAGAFYVFGNLGRSGAIASYEIVPGDRVSVTARDVQDYARRFRTQNIPALAAIDARLEEAEVAGVYVSDDELAEMIRNILQQSFPNGYTNAQYKGLVAQQGLSIPQFEKTIREQLIMQRIEALKSMGALGASRVVSSREVYAAWANDNTELTLDYVAVEAKDLEQEYDITDFEPEEVTEFYERVKANPVEYAWALENYQVPQRYDLEVAFVHFDETDEATTPSLFEVDEEPSEDELRAYYEDHLAWFTPEPEEGDDAAGDEESDDESSGDEPSDDESSGEEADEAGNTPEATPFEEVKEEIRKRVILTRAFDRLYEKLLEQRSAGEPIDLELFAGDHGVFYHELSEADAEAVDADETIGYEGLGTELATYAVGDLSAGVVTERSDALFIFRLARVFEPDFKSQRVVDLLLRGDLIKEKAKQDAIQRARDLYDEMDAWIEKRIREERGETTEEDGDATEDAGESDESEADEPAEDEPAEDEPAEDEPAEDEPAEDDDAARLSEAELQTEKRERLTEAFDVVLPEKGYEIRRLGPHPYMPRGSEEWEAEEDPVIKFLFSFGFVNSLDPGRVEGRSIIDRENDIAYVVRMVAKEKPAPAEMPAEAFDEYREQELLQKFQIGRQMVEFQAQQWLSNIKLEGPGIPTGGQGGGPGGMPAPPR